MAKIQIEVLENWYESLSSNFIK